jgi:hypothetical protein
VLLRRHLRRSLASVGAAIATLALLVGPATAASPTVESWTNHVDRPYLECAGFDAVGVWDIRHKLTFFFNSSGVAIRDTERVDYAGRFVNSVTGAWVADSGSTTYFDTLAPDGSYLTTYANVVRHSAYIHSGGRIDFQTGTYHGNDGESAAGVAALCAALGE